MYVLEMDEWMEERKWNKEIIIDVYIGWGFYNWDIIFILILKWLLQWGLKLEFEYIERQSNNLWIIEYVREFCEIIIILNIRRWTIKKRFTVVNNMEKLYYYFKWLFQCKEDDCDYNNVRSWIFFIFLTERREYVMEILNTPLSYPNLMYNFIASNYILIPDFSFPFFNFFFYLNIIN